MEVWSKAGAFIQINLLSDRGVAANPQFTQFTITPAHDNHNADGEFDLHWRQNHNYFGDSCDHYCCYAPLVLRHSCYPV